MSEPQIISAANGQASGEALTAEFLAELQQG